MLQNHIQGKTLMHPNNYYDIKVNFLSIHNLNLELLNCIPLKNNIFMKKTMYNYLVLLVFTGLLSCKSNQKNEKVESAQSVPTVSNETKAEVVNDAKEWLGLIYDNNYSQSWDNAASLFQKAVTKEQWTQQLSGIVPPLGKVISREVISAEYHTELPGAPDGEYIVIQFKTSFENKNESVETVTQMIDDDQWKVSGYFIK